MNTAQQAIALFLLAAISGFFVRRAVASSLREPARFPQANWGLPEAILALGLAALFLWMALASASSAPSQINLNAVLSSLVLYAVLAFFICAFLVARGLNPIAAFGLRWAEWKAGLLTIPIALLLAFPFIYLAQWVAYQLSGPSAEPQPIVTFLLENPGWQERLAVAAVAVIAAPIAEELIFRGCVYGVCRKFAGRLAAMFFTSVVFALIHGHLASLPGLFVLSIALTLVYEKTGSLWAPIGLHALFNGLTVLSAILWPDLAQ